MLVVICKCRPERSTVTLLKFVAIRGILSLKKSSGEEDKVSRFLKKLTGTGQGIRSLKKVGMKRTFLL